MFVPVFLVIQICFIFLRSDLFEIIDFLKNVTMKSEADKKDFFRYVIVLHSLEFNWRG